MINGKDFEGHRKQLIQGVCVCVLCFHNFLDYFYQSFLLIVIFSWPISV